MIYNYIKISESNLWYYAFQMINEFLFHCVKFQNYQIKFEFQKALFWISANLSKLRMKEFGFFIVWKFYFGNFTFSFSFSFPFHAENLTNYKSEQFIIFMNKLPNSRKKTKISWLKNDLCLLQSWNQISYYHFNFRSINIFFLKYWYKSEEYDLILIVNETGTKVLFTDINEITNCLIKYRVLKVLDSSILVILSTEN
jgi:hypothetical protein